MTTDTVVSGVHFLPSDPPDSVAAKALSVNLSDLAAMGAFPRAYTLSIGLPQAWKWAETERWLEGFVRRLARDQLEAGIHLIGGDTVATPGPLCITVTAFGMVREGLELRRSSARPGDVVYVSGMIGDAALGLKWIAGELPTLAAEFSHVLAHRYRFPQARNELGRRLIGIARGVADVSDGLVADLEHVCAASNVLATVDASRVPLSAATRAAIAANPDLLTVALTGGDDYELVFTAPRASEERLRSVSDELEIPLTAIGRIETHASRPTKHHVRVMGADGRPIGIGTRGFQHF